jgi:hypothetical protein
MVFRLVDTVPRVTRHDLADGFRHLTLEQRLAEIGAVDLRDNSLLADQGDGYVTVLAIDAAKRWKSAAPPVL